jgi:hypothetical protein
MTSCSFEKYPETAEELPLRRAQARRLNVQARAALIRKTIGFD